MLENIELETKAGKSLVMEAYDKDVASSDKLGSANAISYYKLIADEEEHTYDLDIFMDCKKTGNVKFTTKFVWCEPDPPANPLLNANCMLNLVIVSATFLKDADLIGKQDPYIKFKYNGKDVQTDVKDGAGKAAEWNEKFCLTQVMDQVTSGKRLILEAYDKDLVTSDLLGKTKGISYVSLVENDEIKNHTVQLFDTEKKVAGELILTSQFIFVPEDPEPHPDLNRNCILRIIVHNAKFFKDNDTFGK